MPLYFVFKNLLSPNLINFNTFKTTGKVSFVLLIILETYVKKQDFKEPEIAPWMSNKQESTLIFRNLDINTWFFF